MVNRIQDTLTVLRGRIKIFYGNFLARFSFFREFIYILDDIRVCCEWLSEEMLNQGAEIKLLREQLDNQIAVNEQLAETISSLNEIIAPNKNDSNFRTSAQILDERFKLHQGNINA